MLVGEPVKRKDGGSQLHKFIIVLTSGLKMRLDRVELVGIERTKHVWLRERGVVILHPGIASGGRITLLLRTPHGREIEVVFDPDDLEEDPEDTIEFVATILRSRPGNPCLQTPPA